MNKVKFLAFRKSKVSSIGTANLNGCSAVMIVSRYGAILAHIPPRPPNSDPNDRHAGDRNTRARMDEVKALYTKHNKFFPAGTNSWVACAVYRGQLALPDQEKILQDGLDGLGFKQPFVTYVAGLEESSFTGQGTVFIDGSKAMPVVYVEDNVVSKGIDPSSSSANATKPSFSSANVLESSSSGYNTTENSEDTSTIYNTESATEDAASSGYNTTEYSVDPSFSSGYTVDPSSSSGYIVDPAPSSGFTVSQSFSAGYIISPYSTSGYIGPAFSSDNAENPPSTSSTQANTYYYVEKKIYYFFDGMQSIVQSTRPENVWVYNAKSWRESNGKMWRRYDGTSIEYA
ncbi:hypothetical protein B7494_g4696 [Chlorociboria aeruginascens]|nr:hypothetical protein B7494_g4696 [Chlorociboria aeruginascens]